MTPVTETKHPCRVVSVAQIADAPVRFVNTVDLPVSADELFEVLADAASWPVLVAVMNFS